VADRTIVNYDELANIGKSFQQEGEIVTVIETQLRQRAQQLESEWIGEGADKFFNEFFQDILPAMNRVKQACVLTAHTIRVVSQIFDEAEEETAGYFKDGSLEGGGEGSGIDVSDLEFDSTGGIGGIGGGGLGTSPGGSAVGTGDESGSGIDVNNLDFGADEFPGTGGGEADFAKVETGMKPVPANEEFAGDKWMDEQLDGKGATGASMGGGGGGGSSAGSQGMGGGLEMGVGSHSQTSSGPGAAPTGAGSGGGMQDHVYQTPAGASTTPGTTAQSAPGAATVAGGERPVQQGGMRDAAGAAGALGGAGAAAGAGSAAAKKLKENKDDE
jgi:WXG100 family type VII secretion target